jgi:hypothetical protein
MQILLILGVVLSIVIIYHYLTQFKIGDSVTQAYTGGLGAGKSLSAVTRAVKYYKRTLFFRFIFRLIPLPFLGLGKKYMPDKPQFLSNIPIYLFKKYRLFGKKIWSEKLEWEHLIMEKRINPKSAILVDEFSTFVSQWEFDNPFVRQVLDNFFKYYRHYTLGGRFYITEQASANVVVNLRRRLNVVYNLSNFRKFLFFWYKVDVAEVLLVEDLVNIQDVAEADNKPFLFGFLPPAFLIKLGLFAKHYDTYCYSENYTASRSEDKDIWNRYKTTYFIELPNNAEMKKKYKQKGFLTKAEMAKYVVEWKNKDLTGVPSSNTEGEDEL